MVGEAVSQFGRLDILVNCAGAWAVAACVGPTSQWQPAGWQVRASRPYHRRERCSTCASFLPSPGHQFSPAWPPAAGHAHRMLPALLPPFPQPATSSPQRSSSPPTASAQSWRLIRLAPSTCGCHTACCCRCQAGRLVKGCTTTMLAGAFSLHYAPHRVAAALQPAQLVLRQPPCLQRCKGKL